MIARRLRLPLLALLLSACRTEQNVFAPRGPAAEQLANLGGGVIATFSIVALIMFGLLVWLSLRNRGTLEEHAPPDAGGGERWILIGGFGIPAVILAVVFVVTLQSMSAFPLRQQHDATADASHPADIVVTAQQWWWKAEYVGEAVCLPPSAKDSTLPYRFTTANELHIPVGIPVDIALHSKDVIHSFWVPQLHGKVDVVPGQENRIRLVATRPGRYRGQCGEFCGEQHANMGLYVVADPADEFYRWAAHQRRPAKEPEEEAQKQGKLLVESNACAICHTIRGTGAKGTIGPDLTHLASRATIASGTLPNNHAYLGAWITHAQSLKPGTEMPNLTIFQGEQTHAVVEYLRHLE